MPDPAGLTLEATGLAIALFQAGVDCYRIFTAAKSTGKDAGRLQAHLLIQHGRLLQWGEDLGLTKGEDELDKRLQSQTSLYNTVIIALASIKMIFTDTDRLQKRYGIIPSEVDQPAPNSTGDLEMLTMSAKRVDILSPTIIDGNAVSEAIRKKTEEAECIQKSVAIIKKLRWAIHDRHKFQSLVADLRALNDDLYSLVPPISAEKIAYAVLGCLLQTNSLSRLENIRQAAEGSYSAISVAAGFRGLNIRLPLIDSQHKKRMDLPGSIKTQKSNNPGEIRCVATYVPQNQSDSIHVLVEWKQINPKWRDAEHNAVLERVNDLAFLLNYTPKPDGFRTLHCIGHFEDEMTINRRFGFVYEFPKHTNSRTSPISLYVLLRDNEDDEKEEPLLGDKFLLALALCKAVYELHLCNWLHKGIRSNNVLFFPRKAKTALSSIQSPFLAGFDYSRPDNPAEISEQPNEITFDLYRHPQYVSGRTPYKREFDFYSLGIVLLEIGLWLRVKALYTSDQTPQSFRRLLLETYTEDLGITVGQIYRDVVRICLKGDFHGQSRDYVGLGTESQAATEQAQIEGLGEHSDDQLSHEFLLKVIVELQKCRA
jgi:Prion-inhibition and propagation